MLLNPFLFHGTDLARHLGPTEVMAELFVDFYPVFSPRPDYMPSPHFHFPSPALIIRQLPLLMLELTPLAGVAQQTAPLTGSVRGESGAPIEFVTLTLHRAADSVLVKTEFSDA